MKKLFVLLTLCAVLTAAVFADKNDSASTPARTEGKWTEMSYVNVPVLKVLEGKNGYVVIYQKNKTGVGNVIIPKNWAHGNNEAPRKLKFRSVKTSLGAYMTIVKDGGEFKRVILSIPMNKSNSIWGMVDSRKDLEGADKDTLEEIEL